MQFVVPSSCGYGCVFDTDHPIAQTKTPVSFFKQGDCEINEGHNVCHLHGFITSQMNQMKLTSGQSLSFLGGNWFPHTGGYLQTRQGGNWQCMPGDWASDTPLFDPRSNAYSVQFTADGSTYWSTAPSQYGIWWSKGVYKLTLLSDSWWRVQFGTSSGVIPYDQPIDPSSLPTDLQYSYEADLTLVYSVVQPEKAEPSIIFVNEAESIFDDYLERGSQSTANYSYICADAADKVIYNHSNTVMNTLDLIRMKTDISKMYDSYNEVMNTYWSLSDIVRGSVKTKHITKYTNDFVYDANPNTYLAVKKAKQFASAYLGTLYGPRLSVSELADIVTEENRKVNHGTTTATRECELTGYHLKGSGIGRVSFTYRYGVYQSVANTLGSWGLSPISLTDVWDAVPYSFVVDWFWDVSDLLDRPRLRNFMDELPVSQIWYSERIGLSGSIITDDWTSTANFVLYYRVERSALGTKLHGYVSPSGKPNLSGKGLRLGALSVQIAPTR